MKIMAIDYGDAHTGIAISDATGTLAGFTTVIDSRKAEVVVQEILRLLPEHGVTELVLGYPKNMDGTVGPRAEKAAAFAETLRQAADLPVTLWDERRTTIDAHNILFQNGQNAKKRKKTVDAVAADWPAVRAAASAVADDWRTSLPRLSSCRAVASSIPPRVMPSS